MSNKVKISRRELLRYGGIAGAATIAGCQGQIPLGGTGGSNLATNLGGWLYEPGAIGDRDHYEFRLLQPTAIDENEDEFDDDTFDTLEGIEETFEPDLGIDFDEVDTFVSFWPSLVMTASFDEEDVVEELDDNDFDDEDDYEGFKIFVHDSDSRAVAIKGNTIVMTGQLEDEDAEDVLEGTIDTSIEEEDRYVDENEDFATLVDALGTGTMVRGRTHEPTEDRPAPDTDTDAERISYGASVEGEIGPDDPTTLPGRGDDIGYNERLAFFGKSGERVTVEMSSRSANPLIALVDTDGAVLGSEQGTSDEPAIVESEIPADGTYLIIATSDQRFDETTVPYSLSLQSPTPVGPEAGRFENEVARGSVLTIDGDEGSREWVLVFEGEDDVDTDDIDTWVSENEDDGDRFQDYDDVEISAEGRVATVGATIDTDDFRLTE